MDRPLVPSFIKKLDKELLLNKPTIWSTRVHLVVWYSLLFMAALALICFLSGEDARQRSAMASWTSFVALVSFIGLIAWLIYLLRFNVFKQYGVQKKGDGIKTFFLLFISMLFIIVPTYLPGIIESFKANVKYKSDEIVKDVNSINEKLCQLNYALLPKEWQRDTLNISRVAAAESTDTEGQHGVSDSRRDLKVGYYYITDEDFEGRLLKADSIVKITDSLYVEYTCPDYNFVSVNDVIRHSHVKYELSKDLYFSVIKNFKPVNVERMRAELTALLEKYRGPDRYNDFSYDNQVDYDGNTRLSYDQRISRENGLGGIIWGISNICNKKYRWEMDNFGVYFRVIFYVTFCFSLLLFIFRHSTNKTFFLSILTAVVLFILTALVINFSSHNSIEQAIFGFLLFYYAFFFFNAISIFNSATRSIFKGIALNLVTFFTSFIPLFVVAFYYATIRSAAGDYYSDEAYLEKIKNKNTHYIIAEIAGVLIFIILLEPLFKKLYRRWYASPEN